MNRCIPRRRNWQGKSNMLIIGSGGELSPEELETLKQVFENPCAPIITMYKDEFTYHKTIEEMDNQNPIKNYENSRRNDRRGTS